MFFKWMGVPSPPEKGDYYRSLKPGPGERAEQLFFEQDRATERPWTSTQLPRLAAWLKANRVDTPFGRYSFEGENNYGAEHVKVKQNQNGRWLVVWPREFVAPGASVVYPAP